MFVHCHLDVLYSNAFTLLAALWYREVDQNMVNMTLERTASFVVVVI